MSARTLLLVATITLTACLDPEPFPILDTGASECESDCDAGDGATTDGTTTDGASDSPATDGDAP